MLANISPQSIPACKTYHISLGSISPLDFTIDFLNFSRVPFKKKQTQKHIKCKSASNASTNNPDKTFCSMKDKVDDLLHYYCCKKLLCKYTGL